MEKKGVVPHAAAQAASAASPPPRSPPRYEAPSFLLPAPPPRRLLSLSRTSSPSAAKRGQHRRDLHPFHSRNFLLILPLMVAIPSPFSPSPSSGGGPPTPLSLSLSSAASLLSFLSLRYSFGESILAYVTLLTKKAYVISAHGLDIDNFFLREGEMNKMFLCEIIIRIILILMIKKLLYIN